MKRPKPPRSERALPLGRTQPQASSSPLAAPEPGFSGISSFLRRPVHAQGLPAVDVLLCGAPFDGGTSFRPGARFGPRAVREASALSRPYSQALGVDVFAELSVADGGDI
ncbi:MAG TPA: arginase family protein, partial [Polyangiaceae bacterium]|nr:arginase family protein [Polyangiaceae bacterium]